MEANIIQCFSNLNLAEKKRLSVANKRKLEKEKKELKSKMDTERLRLKRQKIERYIANFSITVVIILMLFLL